VNEHLLPRGDDLFHGKQGRTRPWEVREQIGWDLNAHQRKCLAQANNWPVKEQNDIIRVIMKQIDIIWERADCLIFNVWNFSEGVSWGPEWVCFLHAPRQVAVTGRFQAQLCCRFQCSYAWNLPVTATCLSSCGVDLTCWAAICCFWPASAPNWVMFGVLESLLCIKIIAITMEQ